MKLPDGWSRAAAEFDEVNLVSFVGLAPVMVLAERAGLSELIAERVRIDPGATKVRSAGANPAGNSTLSHKRPVPLSRLFRLFRTNPS